MLLFWTFYSAIILKKSIMISKKKRKKFFDQMNSERSCDTEDWSNNAKN